MLGTLVPLSIFATWVMVVELYTVPKLLTVFLIDPVDFHIYRLAGEALNHGRSLYSGDFLPGLPFTYPPFAGTLFRVLPLIGPLEGTIMWQGLNALGLLIVLWLIYKEFLPALFLTIGSLGFDAIHGSFFYGQINLVLMFLVALDFLPKNRNRWAGVGVGLAAGLKLTPAFFIIIFIIERRWRAVATTISTFLLTVFIGWLFVPDATRFWTWAIKDSSRVGIHANPGAQSLRSVMERVLHIPQWWLVAVIIVFALVILAIWLAVRRNDMGWAMVLGGIGACLVSPFSWFHHWVWIIPLFALLTRNLGRSNLQQFATTIASFALLAPHMTYFVSPHTATSLDPNNIWYLGTGLMIIVGYCVYGIFGQYGRRRTETRRQAGETDQAISDTSPQLSHPQPDTTNHAAETAPADVDNRHLCR